MRECKYCGSVYEPINNDIDDIFCPFCGKTYHGETLSNELDYYDIDYSENRKKYWLGLGLYFGIFYIVAVIIQVIVSAVVLIANGWTGELLEGSIQYEKYMNDTLAWSNFLIYVAAIASITPFTAKLFKHDFKQLKLQPGLIFKWFGFGMLIMYGGVIASNIIINVITFIFNLPLGESTNQMTIEAIMGSSFTNFFLMSTMTVIMAPFIEEIIFRRCLFGIFKNRTFKTVILSALIFSAIHVVPACLTMIPSVLIGETSFSLLFLEFLYILNYIGQGFALSIVYHKTRGNLIPCIMIHFVNNFIATVSIIFTLLLNNF